MKNHDNWWGQGDWYTGLTVQNLGYSTATVRVIYYNNNGTWRWTEPDRQIPAGSSTVYNPAPSNGSITSFKGSAVVIADQPLAVVVNHTASSGNQDAAMGHSGLNH